jgi:xylose dehydrogenase (NAD/NADP)
VSVRWGILSTARINRLVLAGARASDRVQVVAVASRDAARARAYAAEHGIPRAHGSYEALIGDPEVDAVYISLPNALHVPWALRALAGGKHVLVEKPLSRNPREVAQAFDLAEREGLVLSEGFMWRHHPQTRALERLVAEGAVGRLRAIRAAFSFPLASVHGAGDARFDPGLDGGALMDVGCYCVSAIRLFGGEPERAEGVRALGQSGVDVVFTAALALPDDVVAHFDCGFVLPFRDELELVGEEATLFADDPWHVHAPGIELRRGDESTRVPVEAADSYRLELENVTDAIEGRAPLLLGRTDAVGQARAIAALYESAARSVPTTSRSAP